MSLEAGPIPHSSKLCSEEKPDRKAVWTHHVPGSDEEMEMRTRLLGGIAVSCCLSLAWSAKPQSDSEGDPEMRLGRSGRILCLSWQSTGPVPVLHGDTPN